MKKRVSLITLALLLAVVPLISACAEEEVTPPAGKFEEVPAPGSTVTLKHGFDAAYPPFSQIDPTGAAVGFDVDVVDWMMSWIEDEYDIDIVLKDTLGMGSYSNRAGRRRPRLYHVGNDAQPSKGRKAMVQYPLLRVRPPPGGARW